MSIFFYDPGARIATPLSVDLKLRTITQLSPVAKIKPLHANPSPGQGERLPQQEYHQVTPSADGAEDGLFNAGKIMTRELVTLPITASWQEARRLLEAHAIHHLILVNGDQQLAGILTERHLLRYPDDASPETGLGSQVDTRPIPVASLETSITNLAYLMLEQGLDAVAITDGEWVRGIVTQRDLIKALLPPHRVDGWS